MHQRAEAELLARWRAGDDAAGREVCERHAAVVRRVAAAHRPRECGVDDLVQEVFLTMFARSERYRAQDGVPFEHWLSRLALNVCRDRLRGEARGPRRVDLSAEGERALEWLAGSRDDAQLDARAAREAVDALLARLPSDDRVVLTWLDLEGRSTAEIAQLTGWSRTLVKVRAFRARQRLRALASELRGDA
jgi:RNA polymerase sigma-70 factor (ECF subfamily)